MFEPASPDDNLTFFHVLLMFLVDSLVYFLLALYIQNVFPGEFGLPKRWYFFVQPEYWKSLFGFVPTNESFEMKKIKDPSIESKSDQTGFVRIENLSKSYDNGKTYSVNSLDLDMEPNEITVLLGHNGAGNAGGLLPINDASAIYCIQCNSNKSLQARQH